VLCLRGGIHSESDRRINMKTSGTATSPKKIKAYPGERVEIRASFRIEAPERSGLLRFLFGP
jgi:hypothetical protein